MTQFSPGCPIVTELFEKDGPKYQKGYENGLFLQVAQGLSGRMTQAVRGTKAGLTDERIEEIRNQEVADWGNLDDPEGEAVYLEAHPEIAKAVHNCELRIQMGQCVIHSKKI